MGGGWSGGGWQSDQMAETDTSLLQTMLMILLRLSNTIQLLTITLSGAREHRAVFRGKITLAGPRRLSLIFGWKFF